MVDFNPVARVTPTFDPVAKVVKPTPQPRFDPVAKVVKPPSAPTPKPAPKPPPKPLQQKRTQDLGQRIRAIEQRVQVIETRREAEAVKEQLADISDAITLLKPCIIENTGENRMAIFDKLESLERQVAALNETVDEQTGTFTELQNAVNAVSLRTETVGWIKESYVPRTTGYASITRSTGWQNGYAARLVEQRGHNEQHVYRIDWSYLSLLHSNDITLQRAELRIDLPIHPDDWGGTFQLCWASRWASASTLKTGSAYDAGSFTLGPEHVFAVSQQSSSQVVAYCAVELNDFAKQALTSRAYALYTAVKGTTANRNDTAELDIPTSDPYFGPLGSAMNNSETHKHSGIWIDYWYTRNNAAGA